MAVGGDLGGVGQEYEPMEAGAAAGFRRVKLLQGLFSNRAEGAVVRMMPSGLA